LVEPTVAVQLGDLAVQAHIDERGALDPLDEVGRHGAVEPLAA
jgi:hypothetical protein